MIKHCWLIPEIACILLAVGMTTGCDWIKARFYILHMEGEERVGTLNVKRIIDTLGVSEGMTIADVGAGSGLFTFQLAKRTGPGGVVYAVDINPALLGHIDGIKRPGNSGTIRTVTASEDDPKIPGKVDLVFFCDTLHYIVDQPAYLERLASYVKPGGSIAIIDFTRNWPPASNRFTVENLAAWMKKAGFAVTSSQYFIKDEFFLIFSRAR
jgi:arsenite methyltransferase